MADSYEKTPDDAYWNAHPRERQYVAAAVSLLCGISRLGIGPAQIAAATGSNSPHGTLRVVLRLRDKGSLIVDQCTRLAELTREGSPRATTHPHRMIGLVAQAVVSLIEGRNLSSEGRLVQDVVARVREAWAKSPGQSGKAPEKPHASAGPSSESAPNVPGAIEAEPIGASDARMSNAQSALNFLLNETSLELPNVRGVYSTFSGQSADNNQTLPSFYKCYRFHSKVGRVVKSFMAIKPPSEIVPVTTFVNVFTDDDMDNPRISRGVILPGGTKFLYFLGSIINNHALKILVMHRPPAPRDRYEGIGVSIDGGGNAIAARFVFLKTSAGHHRDAGIGVMDVEIARKEIGDANLNRIRNRVPFSLEKSQVVKSKDRVISARKLTSEVLLALRNSGAEFTMNGEEFNPADEETFTYNSALTIWNEREER